MYGQTVAAADLFGDGVPDVVVTAPCEDLAGLRCVGRVHVYQRTASGTEVISLEPTVAAMDLAFGLRMVAIDASTAGRAGVRIATPFAGMGHVFAYRVEADGTLSGPVELDAPGLAAEAAFGYFMGAVGMWPVMGRSSSPSARRETRTPRGGAAANKDAALQVDERRDADIERSAREPIEHCLAPVWRRREHEPQRVRNLSLVGEPDLRRVEWRAWCS